MTMKVKLTNPVEFNLVNLLLNLSRSLDFSNSGIMDHHRKVTFIALKLGHKAGLSDKELMELFKSSIIHDIGAVNYQDKLMLINFDIKNPWPHCTRGSNFVSEIPDLVSTAGIIYSHHDRWQGGNPSGLTGNSIPLASRIIHLADRIDVMMDRNIYILEQTKDILRQIGSLSGQIFDPDLTDLFFELSKQESFWFDLTAPWIDDCMLELIPSALISVKRENLLTVARLFAQVVDDRSSFTYRHSLYVGRICRVLAQNAGLSNDEAYLLEVAGLLHDLGKLAVPEYIIEKPGRLTANEFDIIKRHSYYTYWLLNPVLPGQKVPSWAAYHHERLDGKGYPFRKSAGELDLAARIVAVADIFTALREDRPYRSSMREGQIQKVLKGQVANGGLDEDVVDMLYACRNELDEFWSCLS